MSAIASTLPWPVFGGSPAPLVRRYRVLAGQMTRIACIVSVAASMSIGSASLHDLFTTQLPTAVNQLFTGSNESIPDSINKNLVYTVAAMGAIDAVQAPTNDVVTATEKARAADLAIFGTASPPMAVGAMLLIYNFAIALVVGLGPLFILCLIFEQTKPLFHKWLMYGIGTVFSLAMLSFVSTIVLSVTARAAAALWSTNFINGLLNTSSEGLSTQSLEQGGIGLLMTVLVITVPPMAGNFFSATLGNFSPYNVFSPAGQPGSNGQPPGAFGYGGHGMSQAGTRQSNAARPVAGTAGFNTLPSPASSNAALLRKSGYTPTADVTKQGGGLANFPPTP